MMRPMISLRSDGIASLSTFIGIEASKSLPLEDVPNVRVSNLVPL